MIERDGQGMGADLRALRRSFSVVLRVHLSKFLLTLPVAIGFGALVHRELAHSLEAERFAAALEPALLLEFVRRIEPALGAGLVAFLAAMPLLMLALLFLDGALLRALQRPNSAAAGVSVWREGGQAMVPLLRLWPASFVLLVALGLLPAYGLHRLGRFVVEELADERTAFFIRLSLTALGALFLVHARASGDVARALVVSGAPLGLAVRGFFSAFLRPRLVLAASLPWAIGGLFVLVTLSLIDVRIGRTGTAWVIAGFLTQQLSGVLRTVLGAGWLAAASRLAASSCRPPDGVLPLGPPT